MRSDDKRRARLNCIAHLLSLIPYKKVPRDKVKLPKRSNKDSYDDQASLKGRRLRRREILIRTGATGCGAAKRAGGAPLELVPHPCAEGTVRS